MGGVVAVRSHPAVDSGAGVAQRMLERMAGRGTVRSVQATDRVVLAASHHPWESELHAAAAGGVVRSHGLMVAADASLYYRSDLRRKLAASGVELPPTATVEESILGAYRAWGAHCVQHLEGDFAFVLWDAAEQRLLCARDFVGRRPLFVARLPDALIAASSLAAVLAHPACPDDLDPGPLAAAAAGLFAESTRTVYRAIDALPPGHILIRDARSERVERHWTPPPVESRPWVPGRSLDEGAEELRRLLGDAVAERLQRRETSTVWMSGGWDSTAFFGAGMARLRATPGSGARIRPVSISYPPGDRGREDEYIAAVAEHWNADVHWLDIATIPFFDRPTERAAARDEPFGHVYEMWNRALARGSRAVGARVALDGVGGDQLFQVSFVYLSDLLRRGRWLHLAREWRAKRLRGGANFWRWVVLPHLPDRLRTRLGRWAGAEAVRSYLDRPVPPWINREFLEAHGVLERERQETPPRDRMAPVAYETFWYLTHPYAGRVLSSVSTLALEEGVELRSPLLDRRIVDFAVTRPWTERSWRGETKRLLRRAAGAWLPDEVLAPRPSRTGTTSGYLETSFRRNYADLVTRILARSALAEAGIIDASVLRRKWEQYRRSGGENLAVSLVLTLQAELWLRSRT